MDIVFKSRIGVKDVERMHEISARIGLTERARGVSPIHSDEGLKEKVDHMESMSPV